MLIDRKHGSNGFLKRGSLTFYSQFDFTTTVTGRVDNAKGEKKERKKRKNRTKFFWSPL